MESESSDRSSIIREHTKEVNPNERQALATEVRSKRSEYFERQRELVTTQEQVEKLQNRLNYLDRNGVSRIWNYFRIQELKSEIAGNQTSIGEKEKLPSELEEARGMVERFYADQKEKWAELPYTREDIEHYFTEEQLTQLSLDDYILLMRRFPSEMVTHVTRHGIRDHAAGGHVGGIGEFHTGFTDILQKGRLEAALSSRIMQQTKEEELASFYLARAKQDQIVHRNFGGTEAEKNISLRDLANNYLHELSTPGKLPTGNYADISAVHFGYQAVLDAYYGSEIGNEIFFTFPMAHMATEYHFTTNLGTSAIDFNNDTFVWTKDKEGVNINTGVVFIPADSPVDSETGSKYQTNSERHPLVHQERVENLKTLFDNQNFQKLVSEAVNNMELLRNKSQLKAFFGEVLGDQPLELQNLFQDAMNLRNIDTVLNSVFTRPGETGKESLVISLLENNQLYYQLSENTIPSRDYWENYFSGHPDRRPSKIVYYSGEPDRALKNWKATNKIEDPNRPFYTQEVAEQFPEKRAGEEDHEAKWYGLDRFVDLSREVIEKYIDNEKPVSDAENEMQLV